MLWKSFLCLELAKGHGRLEASYFLIDSLDDKRYINTITEESYIDRVSIHSSFCGIRPLITFSKNKGVPTNDGKYKLIGDSTLLVEYGYYPQELVSEDIISKALVSDKIFNKKNNLVLFDSNDTLLSNDNLPIYLYNDEMFIQYIVDENSLEPKKEVFKLLPVKWFVDLGQNVMISVNTLDFGIKMVKDNQSKYFSFNGSNMDKFLNNRFKRNLTQCIQKVHYINLKVVHDLIWCEKITPISDQKLAEELGLDLLGLIRRPLFGISVSTKEEEDRKDQENNIPSSNNNQKDSMNDKDLKDKKLINSKEKDYSFNNQAVTMSGKFIQVMFNNQIYSLPLDNYISSDIRIQDDVNFVYDFNNNIVRNDKTEEETFKINNALRIAYLKRLNKIPLSEELKEYIKKYDKSIEYNSLSSVTTVKTIVNELAYIYFTEYTSKQLNENVFHTKPNGVNLDKGFDDEYYENIKLGRSK